MCPPPSIKHSTIILMAVNAFTHRSHHKKLPIERKPHRTIPCKTRKPHKQLKQLYLISKPLPFSIIFGRQDTTHIKMSLRPKSKTIQETEPEEIKNPPPPPPPPSFSQQALARTLASTAHLANLLPTGTLLAFQLLTPVFTNNGSCDAVSNLMTRVLLFLLAASCFLACFTDSFRSPDDGRLYYGFATPRGMRLFDYDPATAVPVPDLSKYRLRPLDFVHAVLSVLVFAAVALRDKNVVGCFYPLPERETKEVLDAVPLAVGMGCSLLFVIFPTRRHGIGYPVTNGN